MWWPGFPLLWPRPFRILRRLKRWWRTFYLPESQKTSLTSFISCCLAGNQAVSNNSKTGPSEQDFHKKAKHAPYDMNIHWKDWCWSWSSNTLAIWCEELTHWKRPWCWERLRTGEGGDRGWDGWMASPTQWTWVWAKWRDSEGQGSLACCSPGDRKSQTRLSNQIKTTDMIHYFYPYYCSGIMLMTMIQITTAALWTQHCAGSRADPYTSIPHNSLKREVLALPDLQMINLKFSLLLVP